MQTLRVLELYSGIGGMHSALKLAAANARLGPFDDFTVVAAVDIATTANKVYRHNFSSPVFERQIQAISLEELDGPLACDLLTMSPPCQPFTRQGNQMGADDPRTASFLCLLERIPQLKNKPKMIFLENVKGFENDPVCAAFLDCLESCGYVFLQCLLTPAQFNVPNSRLRFYCLAIQQSIATNEVFSTDRNKIFKTTSFIGPEIPLTNTLSEYLEHNTDGAYLDSFSIDESALLKNAMVLDIVDPTSRNSCCFTKSYGRYMKGTGSILNMSSIEELDEAYRELKDGSPASLKDLKLRLFTPREVASLMCFPSSFNFPEGTTRKEQYRLLGNSINVLVVNRLLQFLLESASIK